jgi:hypothetical protein
MNFRHLDEKKKKRKGNKTESLPDFPGREKVKFGEVVEAPPKLSFPKVPSLLHITTCELRLYDLVSGLHIDGIILL